MAEMMADRWILSAAPLGLNGGLRPGCDNRVWKTSRKRKPGKSSEPTFLRQQRFTSKTGRCIHFRYA